MVEIIKYLEKQNERLQKIESLLTASKEVMNLDEVSEFTGLSKSHIYKLTSAGKIPHFKQSKHLFFDRKEIIKFLKQNRIKTEEELQDEAKNALNLKGGEK
mgnify:CR=1 FL=1